MMNLQALRSYCLELPYVTEGVKWENDLCFMVAGKIFCITGFDSPLMVSLKVGDEEFEELSTKVGIVPAPYLARYKWILVKDASVFTKKEWEQRVRQSYDLVKSKIPVRVLKKHLAKAVE
jgi:predicted DNA-binding protein (MmcQ/YjbR family)